MAYVLVEFDQCDGGGIATLHNSWLTPRKKEAFWPPYKEQYQFEKALKNGASINTETWKLYKINKILYSCDDLVKVKAKGKDAELTSNLESDEGGGVSPKRRRKINKRFLPTSSDDEEEGTSATFLPRPPNIKRIINDSSARNSPTLVNETEIITTTPQSRPHTSVFSCDSEKIGKLISIVAGIKEQNKEILEWIRKQDDKVVKPTGIRPDLSVELPLESITALNRLEEDLGSERHSNDLVSYLSSLGGKDTVSRTNRILKYLLKDVVASTFSYYGKRSNKRPFLELNLRKIIVDAVKLSSPQSTDRDVEESIKIWLKHAPERMKKHGARQEN